MPGSHIKLVCGKHQTQFPLKNVSWQSKSSVSKISIESMFWVLICLNYLWDESLFLRISATVVFSPRRHVITHSAFHPFAERTPRLITYSPGRIWQSEDNKVQYRGPSLAKHLHPVVITRSRCATSLPVLDRVYLRLCVCKVRTYALLAAKKKHNSRLDSCYV